MLNRIVKRSFFVLIVLLSWSSAEAQQTIPDSADGVVYRGDFESVARGVIDGNLIETNFRNHGELSRWNDLPWGVWPRGVGGRHIDGVGVVVSAYVDALYSDRVDNVQEYIDFFGSGFGADTTLNPVSINYRQAGARISPYSGDLWGWLPLPGFNNPLRIDPVTLGAAPVPALSNDMTSWPSFWPDRLGEDDPGWPGTWNGRDGRFASADLESYYVMDDFSDLEYAANIETTGPHSALGVYFPSPNEDPTMGGLGLQTQIRLFQWANILAEDTMFIIYRVTNKSENDQTRLFFSQIVDYGLGVEEDDDNANYDPFLDLVFGWDSDGIGEPTQAGDSPYETGYTGFAFLESPANDVNAIDDDLDGITDESRFDENYLLFTTLSEITTYASGQYDVAQFEVFHGEPVEDRPAADAERWFTTDENLDWVGFNDANDNGVFDSGETLNNDVGRDGLGPFELEYPGPDEGEGDGLPTNGEPNYNELDVDESDQIGLTGFDLNTRPFYESGDNLRDDTWLFERIALTLFSNPDYVEPSTVVADEPFILFTSGEVELFSENDPTAKSTDFFSTAWIFGSDEDDFFKNRRTVQNIYNSDYNFAQPPITPTLSAVAGDNQVLLSWDTLSIRSFDRFLQDFDFEGYRLYKGTDNLLSDARTITDVNGTPTFYEPIAQWDLDNEFSGNITVLEGEAVYNLGDNTGLQFFYVDNDVTNGKIYYYAIVAYDRGIPSAGGDDPGIDPQENTFRIALNAAGSVTGTSSNAAIVIPTTLPAGYVQGGSTVDLSSVTTGTATGFASVDIIIDSEVNDDNAYEVTFGATDSDLGVYRETSTYSVRELTEGVDVISASDYSSASSIVDGFIINFSNDTPGDIIENRTGWISNEGQENELFGLDPSELDGLSTDWQLSIAPDDDLVTVNFVRTDHDYELLFVDPADSTYRPPLLFGQGFTRVDLPVFARNVTTGDQADLFFRDNDGTGTISGGDVLFISEADSLNRQIYRFTISVFADGEGTPPSPGDKIRVSTTRQFGPDDTFRFGVTSGTVDNDLASQELDDIFVAPNPYLGAASWERGSSSIGRGERKIEFFNLPRLCTIRIFNIRGELIRTIEHSGALNDGSASWDLKSNDSEDVAYGIYFYHVEAPGVGEFTDKFAIVK